MVEIDQLVMVIVIEQDVVCVEVGMVQVGMVEMGDQVFGFFLGCVLICNQCVVGQ